MNPGSSGGPLLNAQGVVVGIVVSIADPGDDDAFAGIGFAVPIGTALGGGSGAGAGRRARSCEPRPRRSDVEDRSRDRDAMTANPLEQVLFEVKRTIVGQDVLLERMASPCWPAGTSSSRACPGWPRRWP